MSQYDLMLDIKIKVDHCDLYSGFSLTPYLESFTPTFGLGTPVFPRFLQIYIVGLLLFLKDVSWTPIFKILVRTLYISWILVIFALYLEGYLMYTHNTLG